MDQPGAGGAVHILQDQHDAPSTPAPITTFGPGMKIQHRFAIPGRETPRFGLGPVRPLGQRIAKIVVAIQPGGMNQRGHRATAGAAHRPALAANLDGEIRTRRHGLAAVEAGIFDMGGQGRLVYGLRFTVYGLRFTVYGLRFTREHGRHGRALLTQLVFHF